MKTAPLMARHAKIYRPARSAMQQGTGKTKSWVLEFIPESPLHADALIGWQSGGDTLRQLHLYFETLDQAERYAKDKGIAYEIHEAPTAPRIRPKSYADKFTKKPGL